MNTLNHRHKHSIPYQLAAFRFAFNGIIEFFRLETKAFIHLLLALMAIGLGFVFKLNAYEWIVVCLAIGIVFITEMFNTAIERIVDHISPEKSEMAKVTKDLSAAAVLVAALIALVFGLIIFLPKLLICLDIRP